MPQGQIRKALSGYYYVFDDGQLVQCRGRGVFRKRNIAPLVGDYVDYTVEGEADGTITVVHERKNALVRPPIANVDQALLVFSMVEPAFNPLLLDRFLVVLESYLITPVIILTKDDLLAEKERPQMDRWIADYEKIGYVVISTRIGDPSLLGRLEPLLRSKNTVLAGQSGVGKSTLLNTLVPALDLKTGAISSALGRGKHTTRHVELLEVAGGLLADTPGFSTFEFTNIEKEQLGDLFPEMEERKSSCKFRGCLHTHEPKCAVKAAVEAGEIAGYRYEHYLSFLQEISERKQRY